jgi:pimeloyl-ACP methyl ester carboxylesterase
MTVSAGPGAISLSGTAMPFQAGGDGKPLVIVHGMVTDHQVWTAHAAILSKHFQVIRPTLAYFGASPWPDDGEGFSVDRHAKDLGEFIAALEVGPVDLASWSLGGAIGLTLAARQPHLIDRLFLCDPSLPVGVSAPGNVERLQQDRIDMFSRAKELFASGDPVAAIEAFVDGASDAEGTFQSFPESVRRVFLRNVPSMKPFFAGPPPPTVTPAELGRISARTTLLLGEKSRATWQIIVPNLAGILPNSTVRSVPGGNHTWPISNPKSFAETLIDMFAGEQ